MGRAGDSVILLHGILRSSRSMRQLERALDGAGYRTLNLDYPSRERDLAGLVDHVQAKISRWVETVEGRLHFITHSMGGLVARALIDRHRPARLGRVVMLGPPNAGSEIADLLGNLWLYCRVFGPAGAQLGTRDRAAMAALLGRVDFELGIIAGDRAFDPFGWTVLPKPNDGRVSIAATRVAGMTDHIVVPATHMFIMSNPAAIRACLGFLHEGRFPRPVNNRHVTNHDP